MRWILLGTGLLTWTAATVAFCLLALRSLRLPAPSPWNLSRLRGGTPDASLALVAESEE